MSMLYQFPLTGINLFRLYHACTHVSIKYAVICRPEIFISLMQKEKFETDMSFLSLEYNTVGISMPRTVVFTASKAMAIYKTDT